MSRRRLRVPRRARRRRRHALRQQQQQQRRRLHGMKMRAWTQPLTRWRPSRCAAAAAQRTPLRRR
jgi:hypothetical protein